MADGEDLRWIRSTANELNNLLQVITESGEVLESLVRGNTEAEKYLAILRNTAQRAELTTRSLAARAEQGAEQITAPGSPASAAATSPVEPHTPSASQALSFIEIHNPTGQRELVLIVDDEEFITLLAEKVLCDEGYRVVTARNGFQALDIYRRLRDEIALVILDFTMPVMDGADVFAELQELNPKVAVVLSSGFAEQGRLRMMLSHGLRGFIPKPYTHDKLLAQVRQTLDAVQAESDL
jgi:CheY-like chemotaxis protein